MPTLQWQGEAAETDGPLPPRYLYVRARVHVSRCFGRGGTTICLVRVGCVCMCASGGRQAEINGWLSAGGSLVQVNGPLPPAEKYPCARGLTRTDRVRYTHKALGVQLICFKMATIFLPPLESAAEYSMWSTTKRLCTCVAGHWLSTSGSRSSLDDPDHPGSPYVLLARWYLLLLHPPWEHPHMSVTDIQDSDGLVSVLKAPICWLEIHDVFDNVLLVSFFCLQTSCSPLVFSWSRVHSCGCQVLHTTFSCSTRLEPSANWPQGLAFTAIGKKTLSCCIEEVWFVGGGWCSIHWPCPSGPSNLSTVLILRSCSVKLSHEPKSLTSCSTVSAIVVTGGCAWAMFYMMTWVFLALSWRSTLAHANSTLLRSSCVVRHCQRAVCQDLAYAVVPRGCQLVGDTTFKLRVVSSLTSSLSECAFLAVCMCPLKSQHIFPK